MFKKLKDLEGYNPTYLDRKKSTKEILINAEELYSNRKNVFQGFENEAFPFREGFYQK